MLGLDRGSNTSIQCHQTPRRESAAEPHLRPFAAQPLFADLRAGALRLGEGGGSDEEGAGSTTAAARVAEATVGVDLDSGIDFESGAAVSALAP